MDIIETKDELILIADGDIPGQCGLNLLLDGNALTVRSVAEITASGEADLLTADPRDTEEHLVSITHKSALNRMSVTIRDHMVSVRLPKTAMAWREK
jgi:hypothetical protein